MKLCKLKLKSINSFRVEEELDFEKPPLDDASLVAITGPTGAGKTTLLDAICVALYGKTPRLTGTGTQNPNNLISHGENECFAEVHFIANNTRYIATWSGKHNTSPRGSLINADTDQLITDKLSSRGKSLGSSENTISDEVTSILGLDFDGFKRSVMLAQGEFAAFLRAKDEDRRKILEATAGIHIYDILKQHLIDKVNEVSEIYDKKRSEFDLFADSSPDQLKELNTDLKTMKEDAEKLDELLQQIQKNRTQETERKDHYENLETSKDRLQKLKDEQPKIDECKSELENAERSNRLRAEKMAYDTTKSEHQRSKIAMKTAVTELEEAQEELKTNQSVFAEKDRVLSEASATYQKKTAIYSQAKSDVQRAIERFQEVNRRKPALKELDDSIDESTEKLAQRESHQKDLQQQLAGAQSFLDQNPLPSDRDTRRVRLTKLQANIDSRTQRLAEEIEDQVESNSRIDELSTEVKELSEKRDELRMKHESLEMSRDQAYEKFMQLQDNGSMEDWENRKGTATKAQLIVQNYEITTRQLSQKEKDLAEYQVLITSLDKSLEELEKEIKDQSNVCNESDAKIEELEKERELAMLADSVNHLRHQLEDGKPCPVCGATDHPYSDKIELDSEELIRRIEEKLDIAENDAAENHQKKQDMQNEHVRLTQDKSNNTQQLHNCDKEIEKLNEQIDNQLADWKKLYENSDISREWIEDRIEESDIAIDNLNRTSDAYNKAKNDLSDISRELSICENNHETQSRLLKDTKQELDELSEEIVNLKSDIESTQTNFWESMPEAFHTDTTKQALSDFSVMIDKVNSNEQTHRTNKSQLEVLNTEIENIKSTLDGLNQRRTELKTEIEQYQNEGESFLNLVREQTEGLDTKEQINDAITELDSKLQTKKDEHDEAQQHLIDSQTNCAQKETANEMREKQLKEDAEKFQAASKTYNEKLEKLGFDSPDDHSNAFRDESQIQKLEDKIDAYENEVHDLNETIAELARIFEDSPYAPDKLPEIIEKEKEIDDEIDNINKAIGGKQQVIKDLEEKLEKRKELEVELQAAKQEMDRWKSLREIIPMNSLRDFALDIMFQQVSTIANVQLAYLTSERYQLKVETIGKLSVIDKWNANEERPVETLSGGESFLTSLALALALSELSQGRAQLNSLFLDEGFGTLDAETLDIAIAALEGLRMQGRSIYLISHIQELTRRLPVKINVRKKGDGSSTIDIKG